MLLYKTLCYLFLTEWDMATAMTWKLHMNSSRNFEWDFQKLFKYPSS